MSVAPSYNLQGKSPTNIVLSLIIGLNPKPEIYSFVPPMTLPTKDVVVLGNYNETEVIVKAQSVVTNNNTVNSKSIAFCFGIKLLVFKYFITFLSTYLV